MIYFISPVLYILRHHFSEESRVFRDLRIASLFFADHVVLLMTFKMN